MNELQVFSHKDFGGVRALKIDGQAWFLGKDVTEVLKYQNGRDAIRVHVENEDRADVAIHDGRQNRNMVVINESGLYSLILSSKLPKAKEFKHWVTSEVLPSIRKTGGYVNGNETDFIIRSAVTQAVETIAAQIPVIVLETLKAVNATGRQSEKAPCLDYLDRLSCFPQSKVESFPPEIQDMVDTMLDQMKAEESFNFSRVARLCTMQGYSITSPTIKKYYDKKFGGL